MSVNSFIEHNGVEYQAHVATIERTHFGSEDHGIVTAYLHLKWGSSGIGVGGMCLDSPKKDESGKYLRRIGSAYGLDHLMQLMATVGVDSWEKLPGKRVFVLFPNNGWGSIASGIANIDTGKAFILKEHSEEWKACEEHESA